MTARLNRWVYRLVALAVAVGMWYITVADRRAQQSERVVEASITYAGRPEGLVLLGQVPTVNVRLRGNTDDIRRLRTSGEVDVQVDLTGRRAGMITVPLEPDAVLAPFEGLEVLSIDPPSLRLELDELKTRRVPIEVDTSGEPAAGAIVLALEPTPTTALLEGASSVVARVERVTTAPVDLNGHALDFREEVPLINPNEPTVRIVRPPSVTVNVRMEVAGNGGETPAGEGSHRP